MSEDTVRDAFRSQARSCAALGSDFTAALCRTLGDSLQPDQGAVAARVLGWPGNPHSSADSVPLRLCGALHALVLTNRAPDLAEAYTARRVDADLLIATLQQHSDFVLRWLENTPQTNEVARSAAIIAAARFLRGFSDLPLRVLELGASAGMNLNFHRYDLATASVSTTPDPETVHLRPDWHGNLPTGPIEVAEARGVDLNPLDPAKDGLSLRAYCWADQDARLARLDAALATAKLHPNPVDRGDAGAWLAAQLSEPTPGRLTLVTHTVAAQYFPPDTRAACEAAMQAAGNNATADTPLAHFGMETDGGDGALLTLRLWDGGFRAWKLGRADFHGRWIRWAPVLLAPADVKIAGLGPRDAAM